MDVNAVTSAISYEKTSAYKKEEKLEVKENGFTYEKNEAAVTSEKAVVYEKTDKTSKKLQPDKATIDKMRADLEQRKAQLQNLVEKMLHKQGKTLQKADDIWGMLRRGEVEVDSETRAQAQKDIAEDGYWGVEQTSDRLVSFAKALAGGDSAYADKLMDAIKKGFEQATKAWGDTLPDICRKTIDATYQKMEAWKNGTEE